MTLKFIVFIGLTFILTTVFSQTKVDSLLSVGNKLYKNKQFDKAASIWETAASLTENKLAKNTNYSYAASAYASAKDSTNSFKCLELEIGRAHV